MNEDILSAGRRSVEAPFTSFQHTWETGFLPEIQGRAGGSLPSREVAVVGLDPQWKRADESDALAFWPAG